jgi:hypothetical protein
MGSRSLLRVKRLIKIPLEERNILIEVDIHAWITIRLWGRAHPSFINPAPIYGKGLSSGPRPLLIRQTSFFFRDWHNEVTRPAFPFRDSTDFTSACRWTIKFGAGGGTDLMGISEGHLPPILGISNRYNPAHTSKNFS